MLLLGEEFMALPHKRGSGGTSRFKGLEEVVSQRISADRLGSFPNDSVAEYSHNALKQKDDVNDYSFFKRLSITLEFSLISTSSILMLVTVPAAPLQLWYSNRVPGKP